MMLPPSDELMTDMAAASALEASLWSVRHDLMDKLYEVVRAAPDGEQILGRMGTRAGAESVMERMRDLTAAEAAYKVLEARGMWRPINHHTPMDEDILLYWPCYAYSIGEKGGPSVAIGRWKKNHRIDDAYDRHDGMVEQLRLKIEYFADTDEMDDYGLAMPDHAPTHWMPVPRPPKTEEHDEGKTKSVQKG